jgi:hypothetical protein
MTPFSFPRNRHTRRHQPPVFANYQRYKEYLRDEFRFRCVYCLSREGWMPGATFFGVEHFLPKSQFIRLNCQYQNLLYACAECNSAKGDVVLPDDLHPEVNPLGLHMKCDPRGKMLAISGSKDGEYLIDLLQLNRPRLIVWRRKFIVLLQELLRRQKDTRCVELLELFYGFPGNMPTFSHGSGANNPYSARASLPSWFD